MLILQILITINILNHFIFMILEMFFWTKPLGRKIFKLSEEKAKTSAALAANQGLYNGFLAVGLIWGLMTKHPGHSLQIEYFFLSCITLAGFYGAMTVNRSIFYIQALPAILAIAALLLQI